MRFIRNVQYFRKAKRIKQKVYSSFTKFIKEFIRVHKLQLSVLRLKTAMFLSTKAYCEILIKRE